MLVYRHEGIAHLVNILVVLQRSEDPHYHFLKLVQFAALSQLLKHFVVYFLVRSKLLDPRVLNGILRLHSLLQVRFKQVTYEILGFLTHFVPVLFQEFVVTTFNPPVEKSI